MNATLATLVAGYLLGIMPWPPWPSLTLRKPLFPAPFSLGLVDLFRGIGAGLLALIMIGTEFSIIIGGIAALVGCNWPWPRNRQGAPPLLGMAPALGVLLLLCSPSLATLGIIWGVSYLAIRDPDTSTLMSFLPLPLVLWYFKTFDVFILFGLISSLLATYQYVGRREDGTNGHTSPGQPPGRLRVLLRKATLIILFIFTLTTLFFIRYVYRGFGMQIDLIRRGNPDLAVVALTFDDGPDPIYTPLILDILKEYDVKASFFLIGKHVAQYPEIAQRIQAEGHDLGNHTYSHRSLVPLSADRTEREIIRAQESIWEATGVRPHLFRPPRGVYSAHARKFLHQEQYTTVLWSLSSSDWAELSVGDMVGRVLGRVQGGDIILFHDSGNLLTTTGGNRFNTVKALPHIIEGLQDQGYTLVPVSELLILSGLTTTQPLD